MKITTGHEVSNVLTGFNLDHAAAIRGFVSDAKALNSPSMKIREIRGNQYESESEK